MNQPGRSKLRRCVQAALAVLAIAALGAEAQQAPQDRMIARLKQVTGNVLVSQQSGLGTGIEAQRLAIGTRVITTANSTVVVVFDNGCEVELKENQRFEVEDENCAGLLLLVQGIVAPVAAAGVGLAVVLPAVAAVGGFALIQRSRENQAVSPN